MPPPELLGSGRLELARWITHPSHPLTPRVFVNRLWRWRFGRGIVPTTDNFGRLGERPTHPELLDWLAVEFVESGWSMKRLHRLMLLSATYQMSSTAAADAAQRDPQNELWSRFPRRRLEAEAIRDAILAVSGQLDTRFGGSLMPLKDRTYVTGTASKQQQYDNPRRSVYQPIYRSAVYDFLAAFDFPDPATPTGDRQESVIAPQSLVMMNSELVHQASAKLAEWVWSPSDDPQTRVERLWQRVLGRPPHQAELEAVLRYMTTSAADAAGQGEDGNELEQWAAVARVLLCSNEFLYID
ncbi:MAG: hypothetical protein KatS3mg111_3091 [Pirellulaceae bacterium]|nr:MAG: hypothetical protein KatS3mg111_3091 [Pirellulaceae bacterium]